MGADYPQQEKALEELSNITDTAKEYLSHHIRNELSSISGHIHLLKKFPVPPERTRASLVEIRRAVNHIVEDLERIGC
jgi:hypothetical protein